MRTRVRRLHHRQHNRIPEPPAARSATYLEEHQMSTTLDHALVAELAGLELALDVFAIRVD